MMLVTFLSAVKIFLHVSFLFLRETSMQPTEKTAILFRLCTKQRPALLSAFVTGSHSAENLGPYVLSFLNCLHCICFV